MKNQSKIYLLNINQKQNLMKTFNRILFVSLLLNTTIVSCSQSNRYEESSSNDISIISPIESNSVEITEENLKSSRMANKNMEASNMLISEKSDEQQEYEKQKASNQTVSQATPNNFIATFATNYKNDSIRKFIRIANLKFKVQNVVQASYSIEKIAIENGGIIIKSDIRNTNSYTESIPSTSDSIIQITHYTLTGYLELNVPYQNLNQILDEIAPLAKVIDYRTVTAENVSIQLLEERLNKERLAKKQRRLSNAIDNKGHRLYDIVDAENSLDAAADSENRSKIEEYRLNDQIMYSNIYLQLYQDESTYIEKKACAKEIKPAFSNQLSEGLANGWAAIITVFLFFINIWPLTLILLAAIVGFIYWKKKKKTN